MGLAVLPSRLKTEMADLASAMLNGDDIKADERLAPHYEWSEMIKNKYEINEKNIDDIIKEEIGIVFTSILEQCGVYSRDEFGKKGFIKFTQSVK